MFRISLRSMLAALLTLVAGVFLYWAKADPVPHDASARVSDVDFWQALDRTDAAQRPSRIVVYPMHQGVQLVTCVGHPEGAAQGDWKYLYISTSKGDPTVEERLAKLGVAYATPWKEAAWVGIAPWAAIALALALAGSKWVESLHRIVAEARAKVGAAEPAHAGAAQPTSADYEKLRALEEELERNATGVSAPPSSDAPAAPPPIAPAALSGGPLEGIAEAAAAAKDYRGEYYPVARPKEGGFSLLELVVVIGIIAVLMALLLPALAGVRRDAKQIACAANLRSIAQGLMIYEGEHNGYIPAAYSYTGQAVVNGVQTFSEQGYTHWSYFLYSNGSTPQSAFQCPELEDGGLPPTNTSVENMVSGQVSDLPGVIDQQALRVAYTLNEALSPRNKFTIGFQGALRAYQFIRASSVSHSSETILTTEWGRNAARFAATTPETFYIYSHRPVHGFVGSDGTLDMYKLAEGIGYRRITAADLDPDPSTTSSTATRLDWVGRNHGRPTSYPDQRKSNFLYVDGHVECKSVYETLEPFEWGETFFTLTPNGDLQP